MHRALYVGDIVDTHLGRGVVREGGDRICRVQFPEFDMRLWTATCDWTGLTIERFRRPRTNRRWRQLADWAALVDADK